MNIRFIFLSFFTFTCWTCPAQKDVSVYQPVTSSEVKFANGFWKQCINRNAGVTVPYCVDKCTESGCLHNFRLAAGQVDGSYQSDNTWLDSDMYKALEAAFCSMKICPDAGLLQKTDSIIDTIIAAQEKDGYLYTARTTHATHPRVVNFMGKERWTNMGHFSHELYNMGHMIEAAIAHYELTGNKRFLNVATKAADLIVATFGEDKLTYPPGHQEIELALVRLYKLTNNIAYLETAHFFLEARGNYAGRPPYTDEFFKEYHQDHLPVAAQQEAVGHAVRAVYMYAAMADIVTLKGDERYRKALETIWNDIMEKKIYLTGGVGNQQLGEAFGQPYHLDNLNAYTETCAAIGLALWAERMFAFDQDSQYYDVIERAVYNGILSGLSLDGKHFYYKNPLESKGNKQRTEWNSCACCPPNLARYVASMGNRMYGVKGEKLYVNMYAASQMTTEMNGNSICLSQETGYPWDGDIVLNIEPNKESEFDVYLRAPGWHFNHPLPGNLYRVMEEDKVVKLPEVWVNNRKVDCQLEKGYLKIHRKWKKGDTVRLVLSVTPQRVVADAAVTQNNNCVAITCGPMVYCMEGVDNQENCGGVNLAQAGKLSFSIQTNEALKVPVIKLNGQDASSLLVPYFVWANRGACKMRVWIPVGEE